MFQQIAGFVFQKKKHNEIIRCYDMSEETKPRGQQR